MQARREFERLFEEKTGNLWVNRKNFQKKIGAFQLLDMDYGDDKMTAVA
jgi:hypothetical protein